MMTDTNKMRGDFEAAFIAQQVEAFGENCRSGAVYRLKRDGGFEKPPTAYELHRREQGMYDDYWIEMLWWAWQASRQAVVVELKEPDPLSMSVNAMFGYQQARKDDIQAIEAHGLRVGVKA